MAFVNVREHDPVDVIVRRFKRACEKDNIIAAIRSHEYYEKPKWKRKRKKLAARKRHLKRLAREAQARERGRVGGSRGGN